LEKCKGFNDNPESFKSIKMKIGYKNEMQAKINLL